VSGLTLGLATRRLRITVPLTSWSTWHSRGRRCAPNRRLARSALRRASLGFCAVGILARSALAAPRPPAAVRRGSAHARARLDAPARLRFRRVCACALDTALPLCLSRCPHLTRLCEQKRSTAALEQEVEDLGAHLNAYTSREQVRERRAYGAVPRCPPLHAPPLPPRPAAALSSSDGACAPTDDVLRQGVGARCAQGSGHPVGYPAAQRAGGGRHRARARRHPARDGGG
jgi:hypothetical protein